MRLGIPQLEIKHTTIQLRDYLKTVVLTIKTIQESILVAEKDKNVDHTDAIDQLKQNLLAVIDHGKTIQAEILNSEKLAEKRFTST